MKKEFKEFSQMTQEEIKKLETVKLVVNRVVTRNGYEFYNYDVKFAGDKGVYELPTTRIEKQEYSHIARLHKAQTASFVIAVPYRFISGVSANDREYKSVQFYISEVLTLNNWLRKFDLFELNAVGFAVEFEERPEKLETPEEEKEKNEEKS